MTFGQTLKQALNAGGVRISALAGELGYDVSYISRWTSDKKLPSLKTNDELFSKIARFIVCSCSASDMLTLTKNLGLSADAVSDAVLAQQELAGKLARAYLDCSAQPRSAAVEIQNNASISMTAAKSLHEIIAATIASLCDNPERDVINCITNAPIHLFNAEEVSFFGPIYGNSAITKTLVFHQMINPEHLRRHLDLYCEAICKFLSQVPDIRYEFYSVEGLDERSDPVVIIENGLFFQYLSNPCSGTKYMLISQDKALVFDIYSDAERKLNICRMMLKHRLLSRLTEKQFFFQYIMSGGKRLILTSMYPLFMETDQLRALLEQHPLGISADEAVSAFLLSAMNAPKRIVLLKSAIIRYIHCGSICLIGRHIQISREERLKHLHRLLEVLRSCGESCLTIINDETPILNPGDIKVSLFLSEGAAFAEHRDSNFETGFVQFKDLALIECLNEYHSHLEALGDRYSLSGEAALQFIERGLEML